MERVGSHRHRKTEVPFGIRAIESGVEVDGVWISRSNTPGPSMTGSPASASTTFIGPDPPTMTYSPDRASSGSNVSHPETSQPAHRHSGTQLHFSRNIEIPEASFDRSMSSERQNRPSSTRLESHRVHGGRPSYQPRHSSHLRFSNSNDYNADETAALAALEGSRVNETRKPSGSE